MVAIPEYSRTGLANVVTLELRTERREGESLDGIFDG